MTAKKDLKRRIRARQAQTGESYTTARRHVLAARPDPEPDSAPAPGATPAAGGVSPPVQTPQPFARGVVPAEPTIVVEEMVDLTAGAERLGFKCRAMASSKLAARVDPQVALARMRDILLATTEDPAFERLRAVCLRGEGLALARAPDWLAKTRQFVQRALAGLGGVSSEGAMLAFPVASGNTTVMVLANIGFRPRPLPPTERPRIVLSAIAEEGFQGSLMFVR